jgi:hypothetical protein
VGTDIHLYIEYKIGDQPWIVDPKHRIDETKDLVSVSCATRNYNFFADLAGVRGQGSEPKGLPRDVAKKILDQSGCYGIDGHSHSFEYLQDFSDKLRPRINRALAETVDISKIEYLKKTSEKDLAEFVFGDDYSRYYTEGSAFNYEALITYCEKKVEFYKQELEAEAIILDQNINTDVKCRLVFWFDN